jgi:hypothetical protein
MRDVPEKIFIVAVSMHFGVALFMFTPYFTLEYIKNYGFAEWLLFGETPAAKVISWPFYIFMSSSDSVSHVKAAFFHYDRATAIVNDAARALKGGSILSIPKEKLAAIIEQDKEALAEAKQANIADMNRLYPGFGDHFRDEFIQGTELYIRSYEQSDAAASIRAQALMERWGNWFSANLDGLKKTKAR